MEKTYTNQGLLMARKRGAEIVTLDGDAVDYVRRHPSDPRPWTVASGPCQGLRLHAAECHPVGAQGLLTPHQLRVLRLAANGHTAVEIGRRMNKSVNTVNNSLRLVYRALGVDDRAHAVAVAFRVGLIGPRDIAVPEALYARLRSDRERVARQGPVDTPQGVTDELAPLGTVPSARQEAPSER